MRVPVHLSKVLFAVFLLSLISFPAFAEQCTDAVHAILPWTKSIHGNADQWDEHAKKLKFKVNHSPAGCSEKTPCVLVYPKTYGHGINAKYGHVAVLYGCDKKCEIQDSNGVCYEDRARCSKSVDFKAAYVIHKK